MAESNGMNGAITYIIGIASSGFKLSLILNAISCELASEGLEVHSISKTVTLFSLTLKQTGTALQKANSVHSQEALEGVQAISDEANRVFEEFEDMLDRVRTKPKDDGNAPTIQQRFQWCFKKHRVTYLLGQLESHKLSLSVILQVLQLGKLMAGTSKHDPPEEVAIKREAIRQERAETQNVLIVRYWQMSKMDRLFEASQREDDNDRMSITNHSDDHLSRINSTSSSQLTIEGPPPEYTPSTALVKFQSYSLGELDQTLHKIKQSPKDMVQVSSDAIDPLLDRWTRWHDVREKRHQRDSGGKYAPSVQNLYDDDDDNRQYYEKYHERDNSPRGYYIEGTTTDWRKPHSVAAKKEAVHRRRVYFDKQPSVSAASSDLEDSPGSNHSKRREPKHHIIDSSSESSDSEPEQTSVRRRRSSGSPTTERKVMFADGTPLAHTYNGGSYGARKVTSPGPIVNAGPRLAPSPHLPINTLRPYPTPDQKAMHHSMSSPLPPHSPNPPPTYAGNSGPYAPHPTYPTYPPPQMSAAGSRYTPQHPPGNRMGLPQRPGSQDGKAPRSPSRLSYSSNNHYPSNNNAMRSTGPYVKTEEEKRLSRDKTKKNLREGATKGLLGAGAIAGFLEALEGLSI